MRLACMINMINLVGTGQLVGLSRTSRSRLYEMKEKAESRLSIGKKLEETT